MFKFKHVFFGTGHFKDLQYFWFSREEKPSYDLLKAAEAWNGRNLIFKETISLC